jgi:sulfite exporter TauE/SafE
MSDWALPLALAVGGFASGLHCAGMCGGISAGFTLVRKEEVLKRQLVFNAGRITSYAIAGAVAGALGSAGAYAAGALPAQTMTLLFASVFALLAGIHLAGYGFPLARFEKLGLPIWRQVQPFAARFLPARTLPQSYAAGLAWGWLPCGLVYGALAAAVFAGGALEGAGAMAGFGLGTLPWLLAAGVFAAKLRSAVKLRAAAGMLLIALGALGLARSAYGLAIYCF